MIKALVFDLDDTLFPEFQYVLSGFRAVDGWVKTNYACDGFYITAKNLFDAGARGDIFNRVMYMLGIGDDADVVSQMVGVYREHQPALTLYQDAEWALSHFGRKYKLGLITDGFLVTQMNKVAALGIAPLLATICYSDEFGRECWKPSPVPYKTVMSALSCQGHECVYVGDNPTKDFITARSLGWYTVQICRHGGEYSHVVADDRYRAHCTITTLQELEAVIS